MSPDDGEVVGLTVPESAGGNAERHRQTVAGFGAPIFGARGETVLSRQMSGGHYSNGLPTGVMLRHGTVQRGEVTVETTAQEERTQDWLLVRNLVGSDIDRDSLTFPVTSIVEREKVAMKVVGRRRPVTVFRCGSSWVARTRSGGRHILVRGYKVDPESVEIVRLSEDELGQAIDEADAAMRRARGI
jgi:hypothetical protein